MHLPRESEVVGQSRDGRGGGSVTGRQRVRRIGHGGGRGHNVVTTRMEGYGLITGHGRDGSGSVTGEVKGAGSR